MTKLLAWVLALTTIVLLLRIITRDDRLWGTRIDGSPRWKIWIRSRRISDRMLMGMEERERRASTADFALVIACGVLAYVLSILYIR